QMMDPMLVRDEADALAGFVTTAAINLRALGQNLSDYNMMFFTDHGVDIYGNSLLVSRRLATENPRAVAGLVRAANRAFLDVAAAPEAGVDAVMRRDPILKKDIELERLNLGLRELILTPEARSVGLGDVDTARFERAIRNVSQSFELTRAPAKGEVFSPGPSCRPWPNAPGGPDGRARPRRGSPGFAPPRVAARLRGFSRCCPRLSHRGSAGAIDLGMAFAIPISFAHCGKSAPSP
ncbi:MAG: ABC transporter substrate-binding protein, partial [Ideonella sp.]|nr:ABC transporter substrate-binding protein [Ideonella sp.]